MWTTPRCFSAVYYSAHFVNLLPVNRAPHSETCRCSIWKNELFITVQTVGPFSSSGSFNNMFVSAANFHQVLRWIYIHSYIYYDLRDPFSFNLCPDFILYQLICAPIIYWKLLRLKRLHLLDTLAYMHFRIWSRLTKLDWRPKTCSTETAVRK
jgi:hypothetical protein